MTAGSFSFVPTTMPAGLALLEFDRLGAKLDRHHDLTGRVGLPPRANGLLLGGGLPFAVDLGPSLGGSYVVGVLEELLLLLQPGYEVGPPDLDDVVVRLRQCGSLRDVQELAGHSSIIRTTQRYIDANPEAQLRVVELVYPDAEAVLRATAGR